MTGLRKKEPEPSWHLPSPQEGSDKHGPLQDERIWDRPRLVGEIWYQVHRNTNEKFT